MFLNFMEPASSQEALGYQFMRFMILSVEMIFIGAAYYGVRQDNTEYVTGVFLPRKEKRFSAIVLFLSSFLMIYEYKFMESFLVLNTILFFVLMFSGLISLFTYEFSLYKRKKRLKK